MIPDLFNLIKWLLIGNNPNWSYPPSIPPSASHNFITVLVSILTRCLDFYQNISNRERCDCVLGMIHWNRYTQIFSSSTSQRLAPATNKTRQVTSRASPISVFCHFFWILGNFVRNELKLTNWVKYSREESKFKFKSTLCNIPVLLRHR